MPEPSLPVGKLPYELLGALLASIDQADESILVGPGLGRDAAVIDVGGTQLVVKNDPVTFVSHEAGIYLVNVNANDLSCLGAVPRWMLVTALLPEHGATPSMVEQLFEQVSSSCARLGISLIGGHTEVTAGVPRPLLVGTLIGTPGPTGLLHPGKAQHGDRLLLVRPAGIEGTALLALERASELSEAFGARFVERCQRLLHEPGICVVDIARALLETGAVSALHDPTEGGVANGVREIAAASGLGAIMNRDLVPILEEPRAVASHFEIDPLGMLSSGTLLAAVTSSEVARVSQLCASLGFPAAVIGKLTAPAAGFHLIEQDNSIELPVFQTDEVTRALARSA